MAKLSTKARNALPKTKFALPSERKYPLTDRRHDILAKARAQQQFEEGKISQAMRDEIVARANAAMKNA